MKKLLAFALALALVFACAVATAEGETLPAGQIVELQSGQSMDLDGDGAPETVTLTYDENDEEGKYTFSVGDQQISDAGMNLTGRIHAVRMYEYAPDALLFVSDYGFSDDPTSYVFAYGENGLRLISVIDTMPWDLTVTGDNTLAGTVRASILQTWQRPCVYVVSTGYFLEGDSMFFRTMAVKEMPLSEYPMGSYVTVTREVTLQVSPTNDAVACVIPAGSAAIIVSTDDVEWLYIVPVEPDLDTYDYAGGWMRVQEHGYSAVVGGETVLTSELFEGLLYAD